MADLPVIVRLRSSVAECVDDSVAARVRRALERLQGEWSVSRGVSVQVEVGDGGPSGLMGVSVGGRTCHFPVTTLAEALAYVDETGLVATDDDSLLRRLQEHRTAGGATAEVIARACQMALCAQPALLGARADPEELMTKPEASAIRVHVEPEYLRALTQEDPDGSLFPMLRDGLFSELGLRLPPFHFEPDRALRPRGFAVRIDSVMGPCRIGLAVDRLLVNVGPDALSVLGMEAEATLNPASRMLNAVTDREHTDSVQSLGYTTWAAFDFLILAVAADLRRSAAALTTPAVADSLLADLGLAFPVLEAGVRAQISLDELTAILRELLSEQVSIRNMPRLTTLLLRRNTLAAGNSSADPVAYVRAGFADAITSKAARATNTLPAYLLADDLEQVVTDARHRADDQVTDRVFDAIDAELRTLGPTIPTPALLTRSDVRRPLRRLLAPGFPELAVLSYDEVPPDFNVQPIGRIALT